MNLIINGQEVPSEVFQQAMTHLKKQNPQMNQNDLAKKATEDVIRHALLRQAAAKEVPAVPDELVQQEFIRYKMNFQHDAEFQQMCEANHTSESEIRENIRNSMRVDIFVDKLAGNPTEPTEKELRAVYESDPQASEMPVTVTAAQIVKKATPQNYQEVYQQLCTIREALLNGADFAATVERHSDDAKGSVLGSVVPGQLVEELNAVVFSMRVGEISPVFQTRFGLHIIHVSQRAPGRKLSFEESGDRIKAMLIHRAKEANIEKWLTEARAKAAVTVKK